MKTFIIKSKNQSGQAVLEYILLLFVILSITAGVILSVSQSTQRFVENYFGSYLECLLETGELPRLGSDNSPETECDDIFQPFTLTDGRSPFDGSGSSNFNDSPSGDNSSNVDGENSDGSGDDSADSSSNDSADDGSVGADGGAGSGGGGLVGGRFGRNGGRSSRVPTGGLDKAKDGDSSKTETLKGTNNFSNTDDGGFGSSDGRRPYIPIYGNGDQERDENGETDTSVVGATSDGSVGSTRPKVIPNTKRDTSSLEDEKDLELGFGDYLKYLIIGIIVLMIIIVLGGQILQFQKSQE